MALFSASHCPSPRGSPLNDTQEDLGRRGWVSSPDERGTMDILWTCFSTIFLCLWSMLHLNVPSERDGYGTICWRKARWLLLSILAPELPMLFACGQWASAKTSVAEMESLGYMEPDWSLPHAFYADSGGFMLQLFHTEPFPITAKQVKYLVEHGYMSLPTLRKREIWDKSRADRTTKFIAFFQASWLAVQIIGRAAQHLPVTPIELATLSLALISLTTLWFWLQKPLDVEIPTPVFLNSAGTSMLAHIQTSPTESGFECTPLDFIEPRAYISRKWSRTFSSWIIRWKLQEVRIDRIPNDRDPQLTSIRQHCVLGVATAAFACLHLLDWNFSFPTRAEQLAWRICCLSMTGLLAIYGTTEVVICSRENFANMGLDTLNGYKLRWPVCLCFFVPATLYVCARIFLIAEVFLSLRSLPHDAFEQVQWSALLPHI